MRPSTGFRSSAGFALLSLTVFSSPALAAPDLPPVKASETNSVAECATPGRLMAFIKARNPKLDPKFEVIASEYMRHGQELGLRWDYGFFQMLVETGFLTFTGDVKPEQNNFAGLGTTGGGVRGEKFKDVSSGARAHLEHLAMYSGQKIENPVAERTKNIQDWEVLTKWQKTIQGPMTFAQLAKQWAPNSRRYPSDIKSVADRFMDGVCKDADPNPELMAAVTGKPVETSPKATETVAKVETAAPAMTKGDELAKRANDEARAEGGNLKTALGASALAKAAAAAEAAAAPAPEVKILNAAPPEPTEPVTEQATVSNAVASTATETTAPSTPAAKVEMAALSAPAVGTAGAKPEADTKSSKADKPSSAKCRVFTASYGGESAVIIKATADKMVNYTVLHVNEGSEKREADAYIAAYAKGGETVATEFKNQDQALDRAFELCPEG
jgi:Mannosyl-glycoprotein endo-beta-N-acetylglucosaminidase